MRLELWMGFGTMDDVLLAFGKVMVMVMQCTELFLCPSEMERCSVAGGIYGAHIVATA